MSGYSKAHRRIRAEEAIHAQIEYDSQHPEETETRRTAIRTALATLPEAERRALELRFGFDGHKPLTHKEIADLTKSDVFTVRNLIGQGLARLAALRILAEEAE